MYRISEVPVLGADRSTVLAGPGGSPPITAAPHALHHTNVKKINFKKISSENKKSILI
jgi:hypothetical protein